MRTSSIDPEGSPDASAGISIDTSTDGSSDTAALLSALRLAGWQGVAMVLQDCDGNDYSINAPIIIGSNYVEFATGASLRQVRVPFDQIAAFELL